MILLITGIGTPFIAWALRADVEKADPVRRDSSNWGGHP